MGAELVPGPAVRSVTSVMSCRATVIVVGPGDVGWAVSRLHQLESRWSRFLATSEGSLLNRAGGRPVTVSADTVRLVTAMGEGWHLTDGRFDPTLLRSLVESGYDHSRIDPCVRTPARPEWVERGDPSGIVLDAGSGVVRLPLGTAVDPGGLGKGLAADLVVEELLAAGAEGALVEIGGDLRAAGRCPDHGTWSIAVDDGPTDASASPGIHLAAGGVATSSTRHRRWPTDDGLAHHLIDPSTGRPVRTPVRAATVIAGSAAQAEALATAATTLDPGRAIEWFEARRLPVRLELVAGPPRLSPAWSRFAADPTPPEDPT
mgnify:CR=1 FL=1